MDAIELATKGLDNDTRGWVMCIVSGIACVFGASIVCVDFLVRLFPGKSNFRIQDSNVFLACSLSLSFGVMLFSSLYSMLPESKSYFKDEGWNDQRAGLVMMGCFIGGFIGIQAISRLLHQFMPSHVVDCDHTHEEQQSQGRPSNARSHSRHDSPTGPRRSRSSRRRSRYQSQNGFQDAENGSAHVGEATPLLHPDSDGLAKRPKIGPKGNMVRRSTNTIMTSRGRTSTVEGGLDRRPSMLEVQKRVLSFVKDTKCDCGESGSCYGYTDPCGQECFKHINYRSIQNSRQPSLLRTTTRPFAGREISPIPDEEGRDAAVSPGYRISSASNRDPLDTTEEEAFDDEHDSVASAHSEDLEAQHHHHVPTNAFLSIGLQTAIAIALHKFPEGFITYATNHVNPALGFNVFMALFVHNISEGFAMCLPLYMALGSRWKAMAWSTLLGGLSQPLGALIAVLWFKIAKNSNLAPNGVAYACIFAVTAGIMVSVALQLFVESLSFNHNRNLCISFAFIGMALLGLSNALFAAH